MSRPVTHYLDVFGKVIVTFEKGGWGVQVRFTCVLSLRYYGILQIKKKRSVK